MAVFSQDCRTEAGHKWDRIRPPLRGWSWQFLIPAPGKTAGSYPSQNSNVLKTRSGRSLFPGPLYRMGLFNNIRSHRSRNAPHI